MEALIKQKNDQHKIYQGDVFKGIIMEVINENEFYVLKNGLAETFIEMEEQMEKSSLAKLFWYPVDYEKFIMFRDNEYFRAQRIPLEDFSKNPKDFMQIFFIDTGEMCLLPLANLHTKKTLFVMPEAFESIPPLAKKCKWIGDVLDKKKFLEDNLRNKAMTFEAIDIKGESISVKIYPYDEGNNDEIESLAANLSENLEIAEISDFDDDVYEKKPISLNHAINSNIDSVTIKQPQEQDMTNHKNESILCFKEDFDTLFVQKFYEIKITSMEKVNKFIFRFNDPDYGKKLEKIHEKMNDAKEIKKYKKIASQPKIGQLVIAKIAKQFQRAKVYDHFKDNFIVWCLDDGSLKLAKKMMMYCWEIELEEVKYLTHEIEITNIQEIQANSKRAMMKIFEFEENAGPLRVLLSQIEPSFKCRLFDQNETDIGENLIADGLVMKKED